MPPETMAPGREEEIRALFAQQALMREIGAAMTRVAWGEVELSIGRDPRFTQQRGLMHGGVMGMVVDTACGFAAATAFAPGTDVVTVEYKVNFLRPGAGERFLARGRLLRAGRRLAIVEGRFLAIDGGREVEIAVMLATMAPVAP